MASRRFSSDISRVLGSCVGVATELLSYSVESSNAARTVSAIANSLIHQSHRCRPFDDSSSTIHSSTSHSSTQTDPQPAPRSHRPTPQSIGKCIQFGPAILTTLRPSLSGAEKVSETSCSRRPHHVPPTPSQLPRIREFVERRVPTSAIERAAGFGGQKSPYSLDGGKPQWYTNRIFDVLCCE